MADREKALELVQKCLDDWPYAAIRVVDIMKRLEQVKVLLKAHEPVKPTEPDEDNMRYCGACGSPVGYEILEAPGIEYVQYNYCPECGQAVKWE